MADSRTGQRFPLNLPIRFADQAHGICVTGCTDDVSAAGVHLSLDAEVDVGSEVDFEMTIPAETIGAPQDVLLRCHGRVVRSNEDEERQQKAGLACVIDTYEFVRAADK